MFIHLPRNTAPPSIEYITPNMSPMPGSTVRLSCNATGSPEPTIQWQRLQPVPIFPQPLGGAYYTGRELVIDDITGEWRGLYQCLASNSVAPQVTEQVFLQMECEFSIDFVLYMQVITKDTFI